mmetsp:Transcript_29228/g.24969  ORF Transcript_29228/g.24969 Transcript_29228/m.24969 type:complete len:85 (+) Transcript_29228:1-255(+)
MMDETGLQLVATPRFLAERSTEVQKLYQALIDQTMASRNTVVKVWDPPSHLVQKIGAKMVQMSVYDVERSGKTYISEVSQTLRK